MALKGLFRQIKKKFRPFPIGFRHIQNLFRHSKKMDGFAAIILTTTIPLPFLKSKTTRYKLHSIQNYCGAIPLTGGLPFYLENVSRFPKIKPITKIETSAINKI